MNLKDKVLFITGASRGIGREIALRAARDGAKVALAAKSVEENAKLPGTIYSVAREVEECGGDPLPLKLDVRDIDAIDQAIEQTAAHFGGLDILVNNASAISLTPTLHTDMKRFDLMHAVNVRATFACSKAAILYLKKSSNPHILTMSPPLNMKSDFFKDYLAYSMSKYGMSMCTLGLSEELKADNIAVNSLWPQTTIATAAIKNNFPPEIYQASRIPEIVADAAYWILTQESSQYTGNFFIDEQVLADIGIVDFSKYAINPSVELFQDLYI